MDPRVVAVTEDEGVVLWRQRGVSPSGEQFEGEVLGLYQVRDGKLTRAQMFYLDTAAVTSFLTRASKLIRSPLPDQQGDAQVYGACVPTIPDTL